MSRCGSRSRLTYLPLCDPHTPSLTLRLIGIWDLKNLAFEFLCQGWPIYEKYPNNLNFFMIGFELESNCVCHIDNKL